MEEWPAAEFDANVEEEEDQLLANLGVEEEEPEADPEAEAEGDAALSALRGDAADGTKLELLSEEGTLVFDQLHMLSEEQAAAVIVEALQQRPGLAPVVVEAVCPELVCAPAKAITENRKVGVIKSFNVENGYGFIDCDEVREAFGHDTFLHKRQLAGCGVGTPVSFAVLLNDRHQPQAFDVQPASTANPRPMKPAAATPKALPRADGLPLVMPSRPSAVRAAPEAKAALPSEIQHLLGSITPSSRMASEMSPSDRLPGKYSGVLKSYSEEKGFGFVDCTQMHEEYGRDVFVHRKEIGDTRVGDTVSFDVVLNRSGQPQARGMKVLGHKGKSAEKGKGKSADKGRPRDRRGPTDEGRRDRRDFEISAGRPTTAIGAIKRRRT